MTGSSGEFTGGHPERCSFAVPRETVTALRRVGDGWNVALSTMVDAAWAVVLALRSGRTAISVGAPYRGRVPEQAVDPSSVLTPLHIDVDLSSPIRAWLRRVEACRAGVVTHPATHPSHTTDQRFGSVLSWEERRSGALSVTVRMPAPHQIREGLLGVFEWLAAGPDGPVGDLVAAASGVWASISSGTGRSEAAHLRPGALPGLMSAPVQNHVTDMSGVSTSPTWPVTGSVVQQFLGQARARPEALAVAATDGRFTFGQLDAASERLARRLRAVAGPEIVVGVLAPRTSALVVAVLSIWRVGAAFLLLDPAEPAGRTRDKLGIAGVEVLVGSAALLEEWADAVPVRVVVDDPWNSPDAPRGDPLTVVRPRSLAYVVFTSGSTGRPKGVLIEHGALADHVETQLAPFYRQVSMPDRPLRVGGAAPVTFDSFIDQLLPTLALGHTLVLFDEPDRVDPASFLRRAAGDELDVVDCAPSQLSVLVAQGLLDLPQPPRLVVFGGEKLDQETWSALRRSRTLAVSIYGATECTIGSTAAEVHDWDAVTLGRGTGSTRVYVLDRWQRLLPPGIVGEIFLGGPSVGRGYVADAAGTAAAFLPDPFLDEPGARMYRTGDLGRWVPGGGLEFMGRVDDQLKIRGFRIEPGEVEVTLEEVPGVRRAAVVPVVTGGVAGHLVAFIESTGEAPDPADIRALLSTRLPEYALPARVVPLPMLPLTRNGKIDRAALTKAAATLHQNSGRKENTPYLTDLEREVCRIWQDVLGVEHVAVTDDFVELGGHSLAAIQIVLRLDALRPGCAPANALLRASTVRAMAAVLAEARE